MRKITFSIVLLAVLVMSCASSEDAGGVGSTAGRSSTRSSNKVYKIGDTGPAGGLIFYNKGDYSDGWRYLKAAPANTERTCIYL
ncbi:hypothetical protein FACS1894172_04920 [Spirochaetia bacterium]|nr:hypothetical protein FACS1894172_04920 [Spirochaetia bacterium]